MRQGAGIARLFRTFPGVRAQLVERVVADLGARHNAAARSPALGVVRLSGMAHAADRVSLREIARQLCTCAASCFTPMNPGT